VSTATVSAEEFSESLTGFEEIAVEKHMGMDIYADAERKPILAMRSLVFVHQTREGLDAGKAKQAAMEMPLGEVKEFFAEAEPEVMPDEPVSESGKDGSADE
jgi:hypothetical protein